MTEPSMKMGKYIAIITPPTNTPSTDMIMGSMSEPIVTRFFWFDD